MNKRGTGLELKHTPGVPEQKFDQSSKSVRAFAWLRDGEAKQWAGKGLELGCPGWRPIDQPLEGWRLDCPSGGAG
jgi:hypothetical protein